MKSTTSSSRESGREAPIEPSFDVCPLCGSADIELVNVRLDVTGPKKEKHAVKLENWFCSSCGERFLTRKARQKLYRKMGLRTE